MDTLHLPTSTRSFRVEGMTCTSCAAKVQARLEALPEVASARVDKATDTATVELAVPAGQAYLQGALDARYRLRDSRSKGSMSKGLSERDVAESAAPARHHGSDQRPSDLRPQNSKPSFLTTYRPLLTIVGLIALVTVLAEASSPGSFDFRTWMRLFMAGFLVVFAGFKLLDLRGFRDSYRMYDVVAERLPAWGLLYPFVELGLGLAYLTDVAPFWTNVVTIVVLGVSAVGVIRSVLDERAIECACLGTGFNLPMSTVTVVEDVGMVAMAAAMLAWG